MGKAIFGNVPKVLLFQRYRKDSLSRNDIAAKYLVHYKIQEPYYSNKFRQFFLISSLREEYAIRGWREYFWGTEKKALRYWLKDWRIFLHDYRTIIASIMVLLNGKLLVWFKENRIRYRIKFFVSSFSKETRVIKNEFMTLRKNLC